MEGYSLPGDGEEARYHQTLAEIHRELSELRARDEDEICIIHGIRRSALGIAAELHDTCSLDTPPARRAPELPRTRSTPAPPAAPPARLQLPSSPGGRALPGLPRPPSALRGEPSSTIDLGWPLQLPPFSLPAAPSTAPARAPVPRVRWRPLGSPPGSPRVGQPAALPGSPPSATSPRSSTNGDLFLSEEAPRHYLPLPRIGHDWESILTPLDIPLAVGEADSPSPVSLAQQRYLFEWGNLPDTRTSLEELDGSRRSPTPNQRPHCNHCGRVPASDAELAAHQGGAVEHSVFGTSVAYSCADCGLLFCSPMALARHAGVSGHEAGEVLLPPRPPGVPGERTDPERDALSWLAALHDELGSEDSFDSRHGADYTLYGSDFGSELGSEGSPSGDGCCEEALALLERRDAGASDLGDACPICLVDIGHGDALLELPCGHFYHPHCITSWLGHSTACPVCKRDVEDLLWPLASIGLSAESDVSETEETPMIAESLTIRRVVVDDDDEPVTGTRVPRLRLPERSGIGSHGDGAAGDDWHPRWISAVAAEAMSSAADSLEAASLHLASAEAACAAMEGIIAPPPPMPAATLDRLWLRTSCPVFSVSRYGDHPQQQPPPHQAQPRAGPTPSRPSHHRTPSTPALPAPPAQRLVSVFTSCSVAEDPPRLLRQAGEGGSAAAGGAAGRDTAPLTKSLSSSIMARLQEVGEGVGPAPRA